MRLRPGNLFLLSILALVTTVVVAQPSPAVLYHLQPGSTYEEGCYGQCLCPILQTPLVGTFGLELLPTNGPFTTYRVAPLDFAVPALDRLISGSGFYSLLGEFDEMDLDLQIDGGPVQPFSSGGFVPAGAEFPEIDIVVSVHQMQECFDYVLHIVASPSPPPYPELAVAETELTWSPVAGATGYDVVCGSLGHLQSSAGDFNVATDQCLESGYPQSSVGYDLTPAQGQTLWFLVREEGGSYDSGGGSQAGPRDAGINASPVGCP